MQVFLSYNAKDRKLASELARGLSKEGYRVWFADQDLLPGDNWAVEVGKALEESEGMVVLVSRESFQSDFQSREVQFALASPRYRGRLVSVLLPPTTRIPTDRVPWILNKLAVIESGENASETSKRIAQALREETDWINWDDWAQRSDLA